MRLTHYMTLFLALCTFTYAHNSLRRYEDIVAFQSGKASPESGSASINATTSKTTTKTVNKTTNQTRYQGAPDQAIASVGALGNISYAVELRRSGSEHLLTTTSTQTDDYDKQQKCLKELGADKGANPSNYPDAVYRIEQYKCYFGQVPNCLNTVRQFRLATLAPTPVPTGYPATREPTPSPTISEYTYRYRIDLFLERPPGEQNAGAGYMCQGMQNSAGQFTDARLFCKNPDPTGPSSTLQPQHTWSNALCDAAKDIYCQAPGGPGAYQDPSGSSQFSCGCSLINAEENGKKIRIMVDVRATRPKTGDLGFLPEWDATDDKFLYRIKDKFCDKAKAISPSDTPAPKLESLVCGQEDARFRCHEPELLEFHKGYDPNFNYGYGPVREGSALYPRRRDGGGQIIGGTNDNDPKTFPDTTGGSANNPHEKWTDQGLTTDGAYSTYPNPGQTSPFLGSPENRRRRRRYGEWHKQDRRRDGGHERCRWIQRWVVKRIIDDVTGGPNEYEYYMQNLTCHPTSANRAPSTEMKLLLMDDHPGAIANRKITRSYCRMWKSGNAQDPEKEASCFAIPEDTDDVNDLFNSDQILSDHNARASDSDTHCQPNNCKTGASAGQEGYCRDPSAPKCKPPNKLYACGEPNNPHDDDFDWVKLANGVPSTYEDCDVACAMCNGCSGYFYTNHPDTWNRCQFLRIHKDFLGKDEESENRTAAPPLSQSLISELSLGIRTAYLWDLAHEHAPYSTGTPETSSWIIGDPSESNECTEDSCNPKVPGGAPANSETAYLKTGSTGPRYVKDGAVMRICRRSNSFKTNNVDANNEYLDDVRALGMPDTV